MIHDDTRFAGCSSIITKTRFGLDYIPTRDGCSPEWRSTQILGFEENRWALFRVAHRDKSTTDLLLVVRLSELWIWRTVQTRANFPRINFLFSCRDSFRSTIQRAFNGITPKSTIVSEVKGDCSNSPDSKESRGKKFTSPLCYFKNCKLSLDLDHLELAFQPNVSRIDHARWK